jgi:putative FmdB family regulatory protein
MPTYEYACQSCGRHVEVYQRFNDEPLKVCPTCGGELRKVFHPAGILFKGSGFYITDYNGRNSAAITGKGDKAEQKSESKPEPKSDACATCPAKAGAGTCS